MYENKLKYYIWIALDKKVYILTIQFLTINGIYFNLSY